MSAAVQARVIAIGLTIAGLAVLFIPTSMVLGI